jgi:hypothetical protein
VDNLTFKEYNIFLLDMLKKRIIFPIITSVATASLVTTSCQPDSHQYYIKSTDIINLAFESVINDNINFYTGKIYDGIASSEYATEFQML